MTARAPEGERRHQRVLGWIADSLAAAVVLTFLETAHILAWWSGDRSAGALAGIGWLVLGLMGLLAAIVGPALLLTVAVAMRFRVLAAWRADMVRGGQARVAALSDADRPPLMDAALREVESALAPERARATQQ